MRKSSTHLSFQISSQNLLHHHNCNKNCRKRKKLGIANRLFDGGAANDDVKFHDNGMEASLLQ